MAESWTHCGGRYDGGYAGASSARLQPRENARMRREVPQSDVLREAEAKLEQVQRELGTEGVQLPYPGRERAVQSETARMIGESLAALQSPIATMQMSPESARTRPAGLRGRATTPDAGRRVGGAELPGYASALSRASQPQSPAAAARRRHQPPTVSPPAAGDYRMHSPDVGTRSSPASTYHPLPSARPAATGLPERGRPHASSGMRSAPDASASHRTEHAMLIQQKMEVLERRISQHAQWNAADAATYQRPAAAVEAPVVPPALGSSGVGSSRSVPAPPVLSSVGGPRVGTPRETHTAAPVSSSGTVSPRRQPTGPGAAPASAADLAPEWLTPVRQSNGSDSMPGSMERGVRPGGGSPISINADDLAAISEREREEARWAQLRSYLEPGRTPPGVSAEDIAASRRLLELRAEHVEEERRVRTTELGLLLERKIFKDKLQRITRCVDNRSDHFPRSGSSAGRDEMIFLNALCLILNQPLQ
eukprot:TRINITY_DN36117_c0_g1_i1.p1 TRINITY_DN36117_c0_g1~~TRINITY_DN36117_c0_g1_i1.p1  ORF type:complete len:480 (+),score=62.07 TRINITY_DN36117_c0_g1_i1:59-1498(+)